MRSYTGHIETRAAANAVQGGACHLVGHHRRAAVVEQHQVKLPWAVTVVHAVPHRRIRVHPLGRRRSGQKLHELFEIGETRHDLLDAHDGDQCLGQGQTHPAVALRFDHGQRAGFRNAEVRSADGDFRRQELAPQVRAGRHRQNPRFIGQLAGLGLGDQAQGGGAVEAVDTAGRSSDSTKTTHTPSFN